MNTATHVKTKIHRCQNIGNVIRIHDLTDHWDIGSAFGWNARTVMIPKVRTNPIHPEKRRIVKFFSIIIQA